MSRSAVPEYGDDATFQSASDTEDAARKAGAADSFSPHLKGCKNDTHRTGRIDHLRGNQFRRLHVVPHPR